MPTLRIAKENEDETHFLTFRVIEWINVFTEPAYFQILIESLKFCQRNKGLLLHGYVVMTNHVHIICTAKNGNLSSIIQGFKSYTSYEIKKTLGNDHRNYILRLIKRSYFKRKGHDFQIWHSENWSVYVKSDWFLNQKLDYIHDNPVVKRYVEQPEDWLYSSARNYILEDNSVIEIDEV